MASKIEVGSEVVRNRSTQRMRVLGFREIDRGQHARANGGTRMA
jgi:hypothetical protein